MLTYFLSNIIFALYSNHDVRFVPNLDNLITTYYSVNMFTNQYTRKYYDKKKKLKIRKGNQNPYIKEQTA